MFHASRPHLHVHVFGLHGHRIARRLFIGGALLLLGVASLLHGQGLVTAPHLWLVAPLLVALSGLVRLATRPGLRSAVGAAIRLGVAAYLVVVIEHIGGWTLAATWPVLLIAVGAAQIFHALSRGRARQEPNW